MNLKRNTIYRSLGKAQHAQQLTAPPYVGHVLPPLSNPHADLTKAKGYSLVELTLAVLMSAILILGIDGLLSTALQADRHSRSQNDALQQARFAMQQMVRTVAGTRRLLIPLGENPNTAWSESVRDVLAVTLDPTLDRDKDGWADANNDKDYLDINQNNSRDADEPERIDEDIATDNENDFDNGITGIDDDNDGSVDEGVGSHDNDEDGATYEDSLNDIDDDNDGSVDEDIYQDMNGDNEPGIAGVDDDYDGSVDEGFSDDDDEDGSRSEDWFDPVVYFLNGTTLMQRIPNINPANGNDYAEYPIAENVTQLRIERILGNDGQTILVDITLQLSLPDAEPVSLNTRVRVGARL